VKLFAEHLIDEATFENTIQGVKDKGLKKDMRKHYPIKFETCERTIDEDETQNKLRIVLKEQNFT
jgi:hypothetical protein